MNGSLTEYYYRDQNLNVLSEKIGADVMEVAIKIRCGSNISEADSLKIALLISILN